MKRIPFVQELAQNTYPGRGIAIGRSTDGTKAMIAYFIMGRSENSRNRIFVSQEDGIRTQAFDPSKMKDPSLIIYAPVRVYENKTIVTNGDQTDTIYDALVQGKSMEDALRTRTFEPDPPNYTPRISGLLHLTDGDFWYQMSILKSNDGNPDSAQRFFFDYAQPLAGEGHFIHTYAEPSDPLPSFAGEPKRVEFPEDTDIDACTKAIWEALDPDNRVSLFVRFIDLATGDTDTRMVNQNEGGLC